MAAAAGEGEEPVPHAHHQKRNRRVCEEDLQSKFCALRNDLLRAEGLRTMELASLQTVQTELHIKRALKSRFPKPGCQDWCAVTAAYHSLRLV